MQDQECLELYNFIKEAVAQTIAKEQISDNSERSKCQLPTTITPDRNEFKKPHSKERACNKSTTIKSLFSATTARESLVKTDRHSIQFFGSFTESRYYTQKAGQPYSVESDHRIS